MDSRVPDPRRELSADRPLCYTHPSMRDRHHIEQVRMDPTWHHYQPVWPPLPGFITGRDDFPTAMRMATPDRPDNDGFDPYLLDVEPIDPASLGFYLSFRWSNLSNEPITGGRWGGFVCEEGVHRLAAMMIEDGCPEDHVWNIALDIAEAQLAMPSVFDRALFEVEELLWMTGVWEPFGDELITHVLTEQRHKMALLADIFVGPRIKKAHGEHSLEYHSFLDLVVAMDKKGFERLDHRKVFNEVLMGALATISSRDVASMVATRGNLLLSRLGLATKSGSPTGSMFQLSYY